MTFCIAGDGVAGWALARELTDRGEQVIVYGDGQAARQPAALVHRHAGRSFRTSKWEDEVWAVARPWLENLVEAGAATQLEIARPRASRAGDRLAKSLDAVSYVREEDISPFGPCFVYGPAFVVDVASALGVLATGIEHVAARTDRADAIIANAASSVVGLSRYGGHLVEFDWGEVALAHAVSGGGLHLAPHGGGVCVGSTWWELDAEPDATDAEAELRARAAGLGVELGAARGVWRGVRAVSEDRAPVVTAGGRAVTALGTRGWFWAAYLARVAADALLGIRPIPPEILHPRPTP